MLPVRFLRQPEPGQPRVLPAPPGHLLPEALRAAALTGRFAGARGQVVPCHGQRGGSVWLLGTGPDPGITAWEAAGGASEAFRASLGGEAPRRFTLDARGLPPDAAAALVAGVTMRAWRLNGQRSVPAAPDEAPRLAELDLVADDPVGALAAWERAEPGVRGALFARDLVAEPGNRLTPRRFAERLEELATHGLDVEVWKRGRLEREGFGALLAVAGGSAEPPRLVVLRWPGAPDRCGDGRPVVFVGKGITFDTGGISIKPAAGMEDMRADMAGAAACAGAMLALALRGSTAPAAAVLAIAENSTGGASYRPGDVVRTLSGRTVEVLDTDAEGRLVLADALHHARTALKPRAVLDLATLTGSIVSALGHHRAGLFGDDDALRDAVLRAGEAVGELLWPMPIGAAHLEDLRGGVADLRNCLHPGAGWAGRFVPDACHAAAFLREFAGGGNAPPWAHLDIAGVESRDADAPLGPKGPTGFGVRLLDRLVRDTFEEKRRRG